MWLFTVMRQGIYAWILTIALIGQLVSPSPPLSRDPPRTTYVAAVYEHYVTLPAQTETVVSRAQALELMNINLAIYRKQAELARLQRADILVFPEDGIYGMKFNRQTIFPYLEIIPDPELVTWSPCSDPKRFPHTDVQHSLSCMALNNSMYIVADMGDKVYCDIKTDPKCPKDGRYQYNTAVAYDPKGVLIGKYHKRNLFYEDQFDTPVAKASYFDTPFGRFGMLICFDLLFYDPSVILVTRHNVTNILFPTAWMDALPLLSALGYHSSFARGLGVNLLSANIHRTKVRFHGSGIYTPRGAATFYYNDSLVSPGRLLVSEIDVLRSPSIQHKMDDDQPKGNESRNVKDTPDNKNTFYAYLFHDRFKYTALTSFQGETQVCDGNVCCYLKYDMEAMGETTDLLALGAFDGLHTYEGQYYFQICSLITCADSKNRSSCGEAVKTSSTKFKSLHLEGHFPTRYVLPQVVVSNEDQLELTKADEWAFNSSMDHGETVSVITSDGFNKPVVSVTLFGRAYDKD